MVWMISLLRLFSNPLLLKSSKFINRKQRIGESTSIVELSNVVGASLQDIENEVKRYGTAVGIKPHPNESDTFLVKMQNYQEAEKLVQMKRSFQNHRVIARFRPVTEWNSLVANN